jgi:hypothetical protein
MVKDLIPDCLKWLIRIDPLVVNAESGVVGIFGDCAVHVPFQQLSDGNVLFLRLPLQQEVIDVLLDGFLFRIEKAVARLEESRGTLAFELGKGQTRPINLGKDRISVLTNTILARKTTN